MPRASIPLLIPLTAVEKPPGVVEDIIPRSAKTDEVVALFTASTAVPSPLFVILNKVFALFSTAVKGSVKPPPPVPICVQPTPDLKNQNDLRSVSYTVSPSAGAAIAFFSEVVTRGIKNPFVVDFTSNCAEGSGVNVPIPVCALICEQDKR